MKLTKSLSALVLCVSRRGEGLYIAILVCFSICASPKMHAQKRLDIIKHSAFNTKIYHLQEGDNLHFKLKDFRHHQKSRITFLTDSSMIMATGEEILYTDFRRMRIDYHRHLLGSFKTVFFGLGYSFFPLNTLNQVITGNEPVFQPVAIGISAALLSGALILREFGFKRLHVTQRITFRLMDLNFENMDKKKEPQKAP